MPSAILIVALAVGSLQPASAGDNDIDFAVVEKTLRQEMRDTFTPGAAIAVVRDDRVVYMKGFGTASVETGEPVTPDTLFRLGSTTKMFTGLAAVLLAEAGQLSLDEPVGRRAPGLQAPISDLTLEQFVVMTGRVTGDLFLSDGTAAFRRRR